MARSGHMAWLTHGVHSPPEPTACYEKLPRESPRASLKQLHRAHGAQALSQSYHRPQRTTRGWDSEWTQWEASLILVASLLLLVRHLLLEAMHLLLVASCSFNSRFSFCKIVYRSAFNKQKSSKQRSNSQYALRSPAASFPRSHF